MIRNRVCSLRCGLFVVCLAAGLLRPVDSRAEDASSTKPVDIGSRRELFVDDFLIDSLKNVRLELQHPQPQEIALVCDQPWEGNTCIYFRVIPDGGKLRMWYLAAHWKSEPDDPAPPHPYFICYAESTDGIHWTKPDLGLFEFQGSKKNNICVTEIDDNFTPFIDTNPQCLPEARYKAVGSKSGLAAWQSPDGIHWKRLGDKPIITKGAFDSQNVAFWDPEIKKYRAYIRDFHDGLRDIRLAISDDFATWTTPELLDVTPPLPNEQFYINCIARYDRAPHMFFGFPVRYVERNWSPSMRALPDLTHRELRAKVGEQRIGTAITDGLFMSSRDGFHFHRWGEAFLRTGPERPGTWVYGDCYPAHGLIETESKLPGAPKEFSLFLPEDYWMRITKMRRYTLRIDGFVAARAPLEGGELLTKPLQFAGKRLSLNFATSAAGRMHVEITDAAGKPLPGFTLAESDETFGDSLDRTITWKGNSDTSSLAGKPVRLRFQLHDADVYSFQFTDP
ncbi:MAG: hypothetical protein NTW96_07135 [Planctomycetia bacterium]|nr:hypothetical protein [Planctomycetia bacterium]